MYTWQKGGVFMLSHAQWSISVQLLQLGSLCLHGTCEVRLHETPLLVESNVLDYYYYNIDIHDNR